MTWNMKNGTLDTTTESGVGMAGACGLHVLVDLFFLTPLQKSCGENGRISLLSQMLRAWRQGMGLSSSSR